MRLPEFCAEGSRTHALLLTYTLDPVFFETVALKRLEMGGAQRIIVLADGREAPRRIAESAADLQHIGLRWAFGAVRVGGSFHPKLIVRFSQEDAAVAVLSGNLTPSGWGRNHEVGGQWLAGPSHGDRGGWLSGLLEAAASWPLGKAQRNTLDEIRDLRWLKSAGPDTGSKRAFLASGDETLFAEITRRWRGRRFSRARISTGSTDADGAFVKRLVATFGLSQVEVFVDADRHSFVADRISKLPITLRAPPSSRPLHAKVVWLSGPNGDAAAWGSPNCSRSAWLLSANQGGNVELAVLDDAPDTEVLKKLFSALKGGEKLTALPAAPAAAEPEAAPVLEVIEAEVDAARWVVRALTPSGEALKAPRLKVAAAGRGIGEISLSPVRDGALVGFLAVPAQRQPLFARLCGNAGGNAVESDPVPVSQISQLLRAHVDTDIARRLDQITAEKMSFAARDAVLQDLFDLAQSEYNELPSLGAVRLRPRRETAKEEAAGEAPSLDPLDMVYNAASGTHPAAKDGVHGSAVADMMSVFERMMWSAPRQSEITEPEFAADDWEFEDAESANAVPVSHRQQPTQSPPLEVDQRDEDADTADSLRSRIDEWISWLSDGNVLSQDEDPPAVAYRSAVFILGVTRAARRARWLPARVATDITVQTVGCFLRRGRTIPGLLAEMRHQCTEGALLESFEKHMGNGRLLAAFVSALVEHEPDGLEDALERGSMLARLRGEPIFVAQLDAGGLEALCAGSSSNAPGWLERLSRAPAIAAAVEQLSEAMHQHLKEFQRAIGRNGTQMAPDIFWSGAEGWVSNPSHGVVATPCIAWKTASGSPVIHRHADAVLQAWRYRPARPREHGCETADEKRA